MIILHVLNKTIQTVYLVYPKMLECELNYDNILILLRQKYPYLI